MADWDWENNPILAKICAYFDNVQNLVVYQVDISANKMFELSTNSINAQRFQVIAEQNFGDFIFKKWPEPDHMKKVGVISFYIFHIMYTLIMICWTGPRGNGGHPSTDNG